ncbi:MAG: formylglycine-generating enzyme family protein [Pseudomonadota bacterium]
MTLLLLPANGSTETLPADADLAPLERFQECDVCPEMIVLPTGSFTIGAPRGVSGRTKAFKDGKWIAVTPDHPDYPYFEGPMHRVEIDIPFAMARTETTRAEWMACVEDGGCSGYVPERTQVRLSPVTGTHEEVPFQGRHPVTTVSYLDAQAYVAWLNGKVGTNLYRLPSEAEWEYAARAGTQTLFARGDDITQEQANFFSGIGASQIFEEGLTDVVIF